MSLLLTASGNAQTTGNWKLTWNPTPSATEHLVYQAIGTNQAIVVTNVQMPSLETTVSNIPLNLMTRWWLTARQISNGVISAESPASVTWTNPPIAVPPPTGSLSVSAPVLTTTNLMRGQSITGTAKLTNGTSATVTINEGWLTARQPGASNASGPFDDWTPGMIPQTVAPGGVAMVTASWTVRADAPFGIWQAHLAVKVDGVYTDGPNTAFTVSAAPPPTTPPAPTGLKAIQVGGNWIDMTWNGTLAMSTEVEQSKELAPFMKIATVTPGTIHYKASNLQKHRDWRFRVRQVDSFDVTGYSNELFFSSR